MTSKKYYFGTLNEALQSENLLDSWPISASLNYGEVYRYSFDDGSKHGRFVSIYRREDGLYERPVTYKL